MCTERSRRVKGFHQVNLQHVVFLADSAILSAEVWFGVLCWAPHTTRRDKD